MKKKLVKFKKKKGWALKEKIIASVSILAITVSWTTIAMAAAISLNPQNFSDSSGAELYGRPPNGNKCGPDNAKTFFVDKLEPGNSFDFAATLKLVAPCAEGIPVELGGGSTTEPGTNNTDGCVFRIYKCSSVNCWVRICSSSQKGKESININRGCGDGILDTDLGEECDKYVYSNFDKLIYGPADFGTPQDPFRDINNANNPYYSHMFGHSCADKGFCGIAICTDKCKVDYSGCYPCPYMPRGFEQAPTTTPTSTLYQASTTKP